jgi:hypothetical protein
MRGTQLISQTHDACRKHADTRTQKTTIPQACGHVTHHVRSRSLQKHTPAASNNTMSISHRGSDATREAAEAQLATNGEQAIHPEHKMGFFFCFLRGCNAHAHAKPTQRRASWCYTTVQPVLTCNPKIRLTAAGFRGKLWRPQLAATLCYTLTYSIKLDLLGGEGACVAELNRKRPHLWVPSGGKCREQQQHRSAQRCNEMSVPQVEIGM